jgi:hypothetical protein
VSGKRVARATRPCRSATCRTEERDASLQKATFIGSGRAPRSARRVAGRYRQRPVLPENEFPDTLSDEAFTVTVRRTVASEPVARARPRKGSAGVSPAAVGVPPTARPLVRSVHPLHPPQSYGGRAQYCYGGRVSRPWIKRLVWLAGKWPMTQDLPQSAVAARSAGIRAPQSSAPAVRNQRQRKCNGS